MRNTTHYPARTNPELVRKLEVAAQLADDAWIRGGLDGMADELRSLRRLAADEVIIGEVERLYHRQCMRTLPEQRLAL